MSISVEAKNLPFVTIFQSEGRIKPSKNSLSLNNKNKGVLRIIHDFMIQKKQFNNKVMFPPPKRHSRKWSEVKGSKVY